MAISCCSFENTAEQQFTEAKARKELQKYRRHGPGPTTRLLRDGLERAGLARGTLLDVGAGIGALTFEMLARGLTAATIVDASPAYLAAASHEAARRAAGAPIQFVRGDFLTVAAQLRPATVVTLDRVICCYPSFEPFLRAALRRAERGFAFSYPRERWYVGAAVWFENAMRSRASSFRTFVHPVAQMERLIRGAGFTLVSRDSTLTWSADVYKKAGSEAGG